MRTSHAEIGTPARSDEAPQPETSPSEQPEAGENPGGWLVGQWGLPGGMPWQTRHQRRILALLLGSFCVPAGALLVQQGRLLWSARLLRFSLSLPPPTLPLAWLLALVALCGTSLLGLTVLLLQGSRRRKKTQEPAWQRYLEPQRLGVREVVLLVTVLLALVAAGIVLLHLFTPARPLPPAPPTRLYTLPAMEPQPLAASPVLRQPAPSSSALGYVLFVLGLLLCAPLGFFLLGTWLTNRPAESLEEKPSLHPEGRKSPIHACNPATIAAEPDPRRAVIACYRAMQEALHQRGIHASAAYTPGDYAREAAKQPWIPAMAIWTLVRLFEVARFSTHPLSETDKQQACQNLGILFRRGKIEAE